MPVAGPQISSRDSAVRAAEVFFCQDVRIEDGSASIYAGCAEDYAEKVRICHRISAKARDRRVRVTWCVPFSSVISFSL